MTIHQRFSKRLFDFSVSFMGLMVFWWLLIIIWLIACIDTKSNGFFVQTRIGREGKPFKVIKIKTMRPVTGIETVVTTTHDPRITWLGRFWRKSKLDELPQLLNIFMGDMSFVGPRPDVPGFADKLSGHDLLVLSIRPGITGPATLKYRDEEDLLAVQEDPEKYNLDVIFPDKVRVNKEYVENDSVFKDLYYIHKTIFH